jgi:hypothetical protein
MDFANLSGPFPSELANCARLEVLTVSNNNGITETLPAELRDLLELRVLHVGWNKLLTGTGACRVCAAGAACKICNTAYQNHGTHTDRSMR